MVFQIDLVFERTMSFCSFLRLLNDKQVLHVVFDRFDFIFMVDSMELKYKKLDRSLEGQGFLYNGVQYLQKAKSLL